MTSLTHSPCAEAGPSTPPTDGTPIKAADKWVKPHGPPVGVHFGARRLGEDRDVFEHNAWDHAELPSDFHEKAQEALERQRANPVKEELREKYNTMPQDFWNKFYANHQAGFFKDRGWLRSEFAELVACSEADAGPQTVLEVGCGAGNTVFPLLMHNENPELVVYATDYSKTAVDVVKANPMYPRPPHGKGVLHASVWDITAASSSSTYGAATFSPSLDPAATSLLAQDDATPLTPRRQRLCLPEGIEAGTVDVITLIYVLSALHPKEWDQAIRNLYTALKPGGLLLIRDYGRHDLAQLRIKKDRLLDPDMGNLYIRGDGTRVYFFEKGEIERLLNRRWDADGEGSGVNGGGKAGERFAMEFSGEDRRLLVNRKEKLQMFRIWQQVKARKL